MFWSLQESRRMRAHSDHRIDFRPRVMNCRGSMVFIIKKLSTITTSNWVFSLLQYKELTPNKTRRAQCANWLIFYREELFGYTVEELRERRRLKKEAEEKAKQQAEDEWKPPVKEVF